MNISIVKKKKTEKKTYLAALASRALPVSGSHGALADATLRLCASKQKETT
jgi:hypothetical protein